MVLIFQTIVDLWRTRLWELNRVWADPRLAPWRGSIERKILRFLIRRHSDAWYAEKPTAAEPLDDESAWAAQNLYLSDDARDQLGLPRVRRAILQDPRPAAPPVSGKPAPKVDRTIAKSEPVKSSVVPFADPEKEKSWQKVFGRKPRGGGSIWS